MVPKESGLRPVGHRISDMLELPKEVFFDLSRVVIIGNLQVSVENHHGLVAYDGTSLTLNLRAGQMVIEGENLVLGLVGANEITVTGRVGNVRFITPGDGSAPPPASGSTAGPS